MDEQQNSENTTGAKPVSIPVVNDITPPPAPNKKPAEDTSQTQSSDANIEEVVSTDDSEGVTMAEPDTSSDTPMTDEVSDGQQDDVTEQDVAQTDTEPEVETSSTEEDTTVAQAPAEEQQTEISATSEPTQEVPATTAPLEAPQEATVEQSQPAAIGISASQMNKPAHRNNRKLAAIVTIAVAILLAGTAVYVYLGAQKNTTKDTSSAQQSDETQQPATPATAADVDQANGEVEAAINALDEAADFADSDLSDTTLGL